MSSIRAERVMLACECTATCQSPKRTYAQNANPLEKDQRSIMKNRLKYRYTYDHLQCAIHAQPLKCPVLDFAARMSHLSSFTTRKSAPRNATFHESPEKPSHTLLPHKRQRRCLRRACPARCWCWDCWEPCMLPETQ